MWGVFAADGGGRGRHARTPQGAASRVADPKIAEHRGRIVKTTGDRLLVEFASVVDAVPCAVEAQQAMPERYGPANSLGPRSATCGPARTAAAKILWRTAVKLSISHGAPCKWPETTRAPWPMPPSHSHISARTSARHDGGLGAEHRLPGGSGGRLPQPLEGDGFEPSVPPVRGKQFRRGAFAHPVRL
jgi:hypothetical protein